MEQQNQNQTGHTNTDSSQPDSFLEERMNRAAGPSFQGFPPQGPYVPYRRKSKWLTGILSFFIPGTGHLYLGLMQKGLMMMLLLVFDILAIVFFSPAGPMGPEGFSIPLVTLFSLCIPVIYFYNIFDALQSADVVNSNTVSPEVDPMTGWTTGPSKNVFKGMNLGWIFIGAGVFFFMITTKPAWLVKLMHVMGSYVGAIILIGAGALLLLNQSRKNKS